MQSAAKIMNRFANGENIWQGPIQIASLNPRGALTTLTDVLNVWRLVCCEPTLGQAIAMSVDTLRWAVAGYSLVEAAVTVTSASLGDIFGRKRIFQLGLLLFVASCVPIALPPPAEW
jgi:MFS family permease